jgi:uncharacterized protein (DUF1786 family)
MDRCAEETPAVLDVGAGHVAACHLNDSRIRVIA